MRWSLLVAALAWALLVPVPALSQTSQDGPSGAQYDQYHPVGGPVGPEAARHAMRAAIVASGAIRSSSEEAQAAEGNAVSAAELPHATGNTDLASVGTAEAQDEGSPDLERLPDTGGPSPLWLGAPLLCAGGLLARRILL